MNSKIITKLKDIQKQTKTQNKNKTQIKSENCARKERIRSLEFWKLGAVFFCTINMSSLLFKITFGGEQPIFLKAFCNNTMKKQWHVTHMDIV